MVSNWACAHLSGQRGRLERSGSARQERRGRPRGQHQGRLPTYQRHAKRAQGPLVIARPGQVMPRIGPLRHC